MIFTEPQPLYESLEVGQQPLDAFWSFYSSCLGQVAGDRKAGIPDFLFISPPKTGTTWLAKHLARHPQIFIPPEKEVRYFDLLWKLHDVNWYLHKFIEAAGSVKGDASPQYTWLPEGAIEQLQKLNPRLKVIFLARRLPDRAWSHARHCFRYRESTFRDSAGPFGSLPQRLIAKNLLSDLSLIASNYAGTLQRWMRRFPVSQFHVRYFEDAMATPDSYLRDVFRFLEVSEGVDLTLGDLREVVNAGLPAPFPEWAEPMLADIYADHQVEVEALLARTFGQTSPWPPLVRPADTIPLWLLDRPDGWRIYFYLGNFHAVRINRLSAHENGVPGLLVNGKEGVEVFRGMFLGELLGKIEQRHPAKDQHLIRLLLDLQNCDYVQIIDSYRAFNLVRYRTAIYGIRQSLGSVNIRDSGLCQYSPEDIIQGETIGEVRARIEAIELRRAVAELTARFNRLQFGPAGDPSVIQLVESYRGFNLVQYRGQSYGIRQSLGPVNMHTSDEDLRKQYSSADLIIGESLGEIRARIDAIQVLDSIARKTSVS